MAITQHIRWCRHEAFPLSEKVSSTGLVWSNRTKRAETPMPTSDKNINHGGESAFLDSIFKPIHQEPWMHHTVWARTGELVLRSHSAFTEDEGLLHYSWGWGLSIAKCLTAVPPLSKYFFLFFLFLPYLWISNLGHNHICTYSVASSINEHLPPLLSWQSDNWTRNKSGGNEGITNCAKKYSQWSISVWVKSRHCCFVADISIHSWTWTI